MLEISHSCLDLRMRGRVSSCHGVTAHGDKRDLLVEALANRQLFPKDSIAIGWTPLRLMGSNARHIIDLASRIAVSNGSNHLHSVSFSSLVEVASGMRYIIDLYNDGKINDFREHVIWHLLEIIKLQSERLLIVRIHVHENIHFDDVLTFMRDELRLDNSRKWPLSPGFIVEFPVSETKQNSNL